MCVCERESVCVCQKSKVERRQGILYLHVKEALDKSLVERGRAQKHEVEVASDEQLKVAVLESGAEKHAFVRVTRECDGAVNGGGKDSVGKGNVAGGIAQLSRLEGGNGRLGPLPLGVQTKHGRIGRVRTEVGVVHRVSGVGKRKTHCVRSVLVQTLRQ